MNERLEHARGLGRRVDADWQREDIEAQLARLHARQRTRSRRRALAGPLAAAAITATVFAGVFFGFGVGREAARPAQPAACEVVVDRLAQPETAPRPVEAIATRGEVTAPERERHVAPVGETRSHAAARQDVATRAEHSEPALAPAAPSDWRDDAGRGDYAAAWAGLSRASAPLDAMEDLLLAGDVARLSGHAASSVAHLSRAAALHPDDPRAPLAAFTLGRVHLEDLGAPRDAALAFARARALAPDGPLAEDALAREVEAWSRAGETETARARAVTYTRQYPHGRRAHAVRLFGALEGP
jgi:transmembrane sensor